MIAIKPLPTPGCSALETNDPELVSTLTEILGLARAGQSVTLTRTQSQGDRIQVLITREGPST